MKDLHSSTPYGTTLIETMTVVAILSILCHVALFNYQPLLINNRLDNHITKINRAISFTRLKAVTHSENVTLCPLKNNQCIRNNWHKELTIFTDSDEIGVLDGTDKVLFNIDRTHHKDMLTYPRTFLTFRNDGTPLGLHNGTFLYCPEYEKASHKGLAISISHTGRSKVKDTERCLE